MAKVVIYLVSEHPYFDFPAGVVADLRERFPGHTIVAVRSDEERDREIADADVFFGWRLPSETVQAAPKLKWVMVAADSVKGRVVPEYAKREILLTNSRGARAPAMAEHIFALFLALTRRLPEAFHFQKEGAWGKQTLISLDPLPGELGGKTLAVLGAGEIGSRVGHIGREGFGMRVVAARGNPEIETPWADAVHPGDRAGIIRAVTGADYIAVTIPHTPATERLIDAEVLAAMLPTAILVNVGRGAIIDQDALLHALQKSQIGGIGLDVFKEEPLPAGHPLWTTDRVIISPHFSGITPQLWPRMAALFADNLERYLRGEPLRNLVDTARGY